MSVEQLESAVQALSPQQRQQFAEWFDEHRRELVIEPDAADAAIAEAQKAEVLHRRQEYNEHPERFVRMNEESLEQMLARVRKNVATRLSSPR